MVAHALLTKLLMAVADSGGDFPCVGVGQLVVDPRLGPEDQVLAERHGLGPGHTIAKRHVYSGSELEAVDHDPLEFERNPTLVHFGARHGVEQILPAMFCGLYRVKPRKQAGFKRGNNGCVLRLNSWSPSQP